MGVNASLRLFEGLAVGAMNRFHDLGKIGVFVQRSMGISAATLLSHRRVHDGPPHPPRPG